MSAAWKYFDCKHCVAVGRCFGSQRIIAVINSHASALALGTSDLRGVCTNCGKRKFI